METVYVELIIKAYEKYFYKSISILGIATVLFKSTFYQTNAIVLHDKIYQLLYVS